MKIPITEYLRIDLDSETWECRRCSGALGPARNNYKEGLLVYNRDPSEIHRPLLDPKKYERTFAPNPQWCRILEYYCPHCGTMVETEYTVPGHPPTRDIELDIDSLKARCNEWRKDTDAEPAPEFKTPRHVHHHEATVGGQKR
jgi:acetone carboxylase gamma subunit